MISQNGFKKRYRVGYVLAVLIGLTGITKSQPSFAHSDYRFIPYDENGHPDKCGYDPELTRHLLKTLGDHWGYGYDSLRADLKRWRASAFVSIDSIGASVQNRALWELTITDTSVVRVPRRTIFIHARTHPGEVQAWWVTDAIIHLLLADDGFSRLLREHCIFHIIPMYNPDGVELELARQNANLIDLESNWNKNPLQPEVEALKRRFQQLMNSQSPIEIALNMHSSVSCRRYFVYHDAVGTSEVYAALEKQFIEAIRSYFYGGIEPWYYFISWTTGTATQYPESWFWLNYRQSVMALTYEDMNCPQAGDFSTTANALLHGIADYLKISPTPVTQVNHALPIQFDVEQNYPNPFNLSTTVRWHQNQTGSIDMRIFNAHGQIITNYRLGSLTAGEHEIQLDLNACASGVYFCLLEMPGAPSIRLKMMLLK